MWVTLDRSQESLSISLPDGKQLYVSTWHLWHALGTPDVRPHFSFTAFNWLQSLSEFPFFCINSYVSSTHLTFHRFQQTFRLLLFFLRAFSFSCGLLKREFVLVVLSNICLLFEPATSSCRRMRVDRRSCILQVIFLRLQLESVSIPRFRQLQQSFRKNTSVADVGRTFPRIIILVHVGSSPITALVFTRWWQMCSWKRGLFTVNITDVILHNGIFPCRAFPVR